MKNLKTLTWVGRCPICGEDAFKCPMFSQTYGPTERGGYSKEYRCFNCGYEERHFDYVEDAEDFFYTYRRCGCMHLYDGGIVAYTPR